MNQENNTLTRATGIVTTVAAWVAGAALVSLMLLTTADVAARYFFNSPIDGVFDLTQFAVSIMVFLGLGYCGFLGGHVAIELLYDKLPRAARGGLKRLIELVGCVLFGLIAWRTAVQSVDVRDMGEASQLMEIPFFPLYWLVAFGAGLFAAVMLLRVFYPHSEAEAEQSEDPL